MNTIRRALLAACCLAGTMGTHPAIASDWPQKPVRVIVPFAAGAGTDVIMRYFANALGESLGQSIIVENRPGANGLVGTATASKAAPDGYTFFVISNSTVSAAPFVYKNVPYDVDKDILPVAPFILAPSVLLAHPQFPAGNFDEFLAQVRASTGQLSYAHANTVGMAVGSALRGKAQLDLAEVPYKSSPQALTDLMGGQVSFVIVDTIAASTAIRSQKVKVLAVTSAQRSPLYPNVMAMGERIPDIDAYAWVGLGAPAGTPRVVVERLNQEIVRISKEPKTIDYFANMGASMRPESADAYRSFVQAQGRHWASMLRNAGVQPE